jgi:hypothetical protein
VQLTQAGEADLTACESDAEKCKRRGFRRPNILRFFAVNAKWRSSAGSDDPIPASVGLFISAGAGCTLRRRLVSAASRGERASWAVLCSPRGENRGSVVKGNGARKGKYDP